MIHAPKTSKAGKGGRTAAGLCQFLKKLILAGRVAPGDLLPSVRKLSAEHGLSCKTVHRALKLLASDGLVASEPCRGYRVLARANDPNRGHPIAYVLSAQMAGEKWTGLNRLLLTALQDAAGMRGWSMLGAGARGIAYGEVIEQCRASRAWGVIVDVHSPEIVEMARRAGLTVVMVDAWHPDAKADAILQDGFRGGLLAGRHLAELGHRRVAWFGPISESVHSMSRFGGAVNGLRKFGVPLAPDLIVETPELDATDLARKLLARKDRPSAVIALWRERAFEVANAAREMGLVLGKDIDMVGWTVEEQYDEYVSHFSGNPVPAAITWDLSTLAETAVARLAERRDRPDLPPMRIHIETRLRLHSQKPR
jgi:DNA-binding LacI/PurR family transcriptional regulator